MKHFVKITAIMGIATTNENRMVNLLPDLSSIHANKTEPIPAVKFNYTKN